MVIKRRRCKKDMKRRNTKTVHTVTESMGICKFCGKEMVKGRRVMPDYDGIGTYVHVTCWDKDWDRHMEQYRVNFENDLLS